MVGEEMLLPDLRFPDIYETRLWVLVEEQAVVG